MGPENHQNVPSGVPASLPVVPAQPQSTGPVRPAQPVPPSANLAEVVSLQAKSLVSQYQQDPYRLSGAMQQLKAKYLADQFHISIKSADE